MASALAANATPLHAAGTFWRGAGEEALTGLETSGATNSGLGSSHIQPTAIPLKVEKRPRPATS